MTLVADQRSSKAAKESPELLAVLSTHTDPVNCVRWSNKGRFLASASDGERKGGAHTTAATHSTGEDDLGPRTVQTCACV